jgi:hypothetical protein
MDPEWGSRAPRTNFCGGSRRCTRTPRTGADGYVATTTLLDRLHQRQSFRFQSWMLALQARQGTTHHSPPVRTKSHGHDKRRSTALDFLLLGSGYGDTAYLLVAKDELTYYRELFPCSTPTAFVAAELLSMWCARFGVPDSLVSDQGSHF